MSFSKAKLKRFNELAGFSSPFSNKDETRKSLKKDAKAKLRFGSSMDAESIKPTKSAFSLFRTPSLPRRLKFKSSDLTTPKKPEKESSKDLKSDPKGTPQSQPSNSLAQLYNKIDTNKEALDAARKEITDLKSRIGYLNETVRRQQQEKLELSLQKDREILDLERELTNLNKADDLLQKIAEGSLDRIAQMEIEMREMMRSQETQLNDLSFTNSVLQDQIDDWTASFRQVESENDTLRLENQSIRMELTQMHNLVDSHSEEMQHKIEEIRFLERSMEEIMEESQQLKEQVKNLKTQAEMEMLRNIEDSSRMVRDLETLRREKNNLLLDLGEKQELIRALHDELAEKQVEIDAQHDEMRESYNYEMNIITEKYEERINKLQEASDLKLKEVESVFVLEKSKLMKDHVEQIQALEQERIREIAMINETGEEKVKIAEIQAEERIKTLEQTIETSVANERAVWRAELDKCQKIAETEIIKCEVEKNEIKSLLEATNELLRDRDLTLDELRRNFSNTSAHKIREEYEARLKEIQKQAAKLKTEKFNYQLTLNNTRSTVDILIERLKKSDSDVDRMKSELDALTSAKLEVEAENARLKGDVEEFRVALQALSHSAHALEKQIRQKEEVFEKLMTSEEEAIAAVTQIGQMFSHKVEESMAIYVEKYEDMRGKYEAREVYIKDMKSLLDEFSTGIELARIELDAKDQKLFELEKENKDIKLENMTYKFKCEQFEKYQRKDRLPLPSPVLNEEKEDEENMVENVIIERIIDQLEKDTGEESKMESKEALDEKERDERMELLNEVISNDINYALENKQLKEKLLELEEKLQIVEQFSQETSEKYKGLLESHHSRQKIKSSESLKEMNSHLKTKIAKLQEINKKQETTILGLQEQIEVFASPQQKLNLSTGKFGSPRTPKSLAALYPPPGKENLSPATIGSPKSTPLKVKNN